MSRHTAEAREPERFECIVGFDAPLDTFFGQVIDRERRARLERQWEERESAYREAVASGTGVEASEDDSDEDYLTLWVGTNVGEVPTVEALADLLDAFAELTPEMRETLRNDREREAHPPTSYQQMVRELLRRGDLDMSDNSSNTIIESVLLHNDEPPSNKFYEMRLVAAEGGYVVSYRNWRAGTKGLSGTRMKKPLAFADAKRLFDEIFREKTGEGRYKVVEQSAPTADGSTPPPALLSNASVGSPDASVLQLTPTGYLPQLLNPVMRGECEELIYNDNFWAEQKVDGKRLLLGFAEEMGGVVASNRRGEGVIVTPALSSAIRRLAEVKMSGERVRALCLDGEELSGTYYVFDLHRLGSRVFNQRSEHAESLPFGERRDLLEELAARHGSAPKGAEDDAAIKFLPVARTASEKRSLFERLARGRREGIVFKHRESLLHPGRPEAGGDLFKFKFQITVDCVLSVTDDQRRFHCAVFHEGRLQSVGYVSSGIRPSQYDELAREGSKVVCVGEVRALYASGTAEERGQLVQPVFLRFRDDKAPEECTGAQLTPTNKRVLLTARENAL